MMFVTKVQGIPCLCDVLHYTPAIPMRIYGSAPGEADPPEGAELIFCLKNKKGQRLHWLEDKLTQEDIYQLTQEYEYLIEPEEY